MRSASVGNVLRPVAFAELDPLALEKRGHRRINALVRAGDGEALLAHRRRDRAHGGAADAEEMKFSRPRHHAKSFTPRRRGLASRLLFFPVIVPVLLLVIVFL